MAFDKKAYMKAYNASPGVKAQKQAWKESLAGKTYIQAYDQRPEVIERRTASKKTASYVLWQKAYSKSPKGRQIQKEQRQKPEVVAYRKAYEKTAKYKACVAKWLKSDIGRQKKYEQAIRRNASIIIIENVDRNKLRGMYNNACVWCDAKLGKIFDVDHMLPVARYRKIGKKCPHSYNNCVPSCPTCNRTRKDKLPLEFIWEQEVSDGKQ